jgi:hypothetical protein
MKRVALGLAMVLVATTCVMGLRWRASYFPLTIDNEAVATFRDIPFGVEHPGGALISTMTAGHFAPVEDDPLDDDPTTHVATDYVDGRRVTFAYAIHNGGRVGVTITGIGEQAKIELLGTLDVRVGQRLASGTSIRHTEPFHTFTLRAGETRDIVVHYRMHDCEWFTPGSGNGYERFTLTYRVLGLHRSVDLRTPIRVDVKVPDDYVCPRERPRS